MEEYVVKISGKFVGPSKAHLTTRYVDIISGTYSIKGVVVGGGRIARDYINLVSIKNNNNGIKDLIGGYVARLNALSLAMMIRPHREVLLPIPNNWEEVLRYSTSGNLIILGGMEPGQSTDAVSLKLAELLGVKNVIILTDVDGVYTSDPKTDPNAKLIKDLTYKQLEEIIRDYEETPGKYALIDRTALGIARRSNISIIFVNGNDPNNLKKAVDGRLDEILHTKVHP